MFIISSGIVEIQKRKLFTYPQLSVRPGEVVAIIGDNGSGKTTFFDLIVQKIKQHDDVAFNGTYELVQQIQPIMDTRSGGERTKAAIMDALQKNPAMLMLDEPSTNLDQVQQNWLKHQIQSFDGIVLLITHDESLLKLATSIWSVDSQKLNVFNGKYADFLTQQKVKQAKQVDAYRRQEAKKNKLLQQIQKRKQQAERVKKGNGRKLSFSDKKAASRTSHDTLEKKLQKSAKSLEHRLDREFDIEKPKKDHQLNFIDPQSEQLAKKTILSVKHLTVKVPGRTLIKNVHLKMKYGDHIMLIGNNGSGKTTLIHQLLDRQNDYFGNQVGVGYFDQLNQNLDNHQTVLKNVLSSSNQNIQIVYEVLASFGLKNMIHQIAGQLSGGQKIRLQLAKVLLGSHQLLILDEPTNYLDLKAKQALQEFLNQYPGGVILVSHDDQFAKKIDGKIYQIANQKLNDEISQTKFSDANTGILLKLKYELNQLIMDPDVELSEIKTIKDQIKQIQNQKR